MAEVAPMLGVAGDWAGPHDALDAYTAKAGGPPAWPEGAQPPPPERLICGRCGGATSLVMQLYAPLDAATVGADVLERYLYIFACLAPGCRNEAAGWSALRAQRPAAPPPSPMLPAAASAAAAQPQPADDWGVAGADDWGRGDAAAWAAAATDALDALAEALQAAQVEGAAADAAAAKLRAATRSEAAPASRSARPPPSASTLPEFYVAAVPEPDADGGVGGGARDAAAARAAQLAAEYEARRGGAPAAEAAAQPGGDDGGDGGEGESWAGEQYERATVRGVDRAYLKFQKRLRRCPEQCLRYGFGAEPLWPSARRAPAPPCGRCGAPRRFEAQLLAPLIHFFGEAPAAAVPGLLADALADWDWTTVTLHACARSCHTEGNAGVEYTPEALWLDIADESQALRGLLRAAAEEEAQEP